MKNKILITLICFLLLPISVFAGGKNDDGGSVGSGSAGHTGSNGGSGSAGRTGTNTENNGNYYCVYNNIKFTITPSNVVFNVSGNAVFDGSRNDFLTTSGVVFCPEMLYSKVTGTPNGPKTVYTFSPENKSSYGKIRLTDSYLEKDVPSNGNKNQSGTSAEKVNCEYLFGDPTDVNQVAYWMQWVFNLIKYLGIIALFVMSTVDFVKALVQNDQDALKKAATTSIKRFILCVLLFFLPIIVELLMSFLGAYGTCNIG